MTKETASAITWVAFWAFLAFFFYLMAHLH